MEQNVDYNDSTMKPNITILNVDDFDAARYAKTRVLQNAGFTVLEARNGAEALEMTERLKPGLVLLDVRLPDIDGRDVCRRIRANASLGAIPVVQTSAAFISPEDQASGIDSGATAYLAAPFQPHELIQAIHVSLGVPPQAAAP